MANNPTSLLDLLRRQNAIVGTGAVLLLDKMRITSTERLILWFRNTSTSQTLNLSQLVVGLQLAHVSNITNFAVEGRLYIATFDPVANFNIIPIVNMDSTNTVPANGILCGWNGIDEGMVTPFLGIYGGSTVFTNSVFSFDFQGQSKIAPGLSFGITLRVADLSPDVLANINFTTFYSDISS